MGFCSLALLLALLEKLLERGAAIPAGLLERDGGPLEADALFAPADDFLASEDLFDLPSTGAGIFQEPRSIAWSNSKALLT